MVIFWGVPSGRMKSIRLRSCGLASIVHWNGALSAFFVLLIITPASGWYESAPIRSMTSTE